MFKRVRWMGMGAVAGAGASVWAQYRLRRTMDEHPGVKLSAQAAGKARRIGLDVRDALVEGREAMAEREAALQAELDGHLVPLRPGETPAATARARHRRARPLGNEPARPSHGEPARLHVVDAHSEPLDTPRGELESPAEGKDRHRRRWRGSKRA